MKSEKPTLALNKKTLARLNNLEMSHVRGGDGDETGISNGICTETDKKETVIVETGQNTLELLTTIFLTQVAC
ncbi:MAG: class I lanthipeptide [Bacteroidota bacterium]